MKFEKKINGQRKSKILVCEGFLYNYDHYISEREQWYAVKDIIMVNLHI